jgi:DNA-binding LacI/PurR family transcriptional regulator
VSALGACTQPKTLRLSKWCVVQSSTGWNSGGGRTDSSGDHQGCGSPSAVSTATVSRVVYNYQYLSDETRHRVQGTMDQLGYQPSRVARRLRMGEPRIVGLVISDVSNPFFPSVQLGIEDPAYANGYSLLLCNSDQNPAKEDLCINVLIEIDQRLIKTGHFKQDSGYSMASELLEPDARPTAVFAANNVMTLGALLSRAPFQEDC